ncbi:MAG: hypothetical protein IKT83_02770, partial [Bacteroidaceae bacterium]|nr:hypothetical protein [Bacteroidaceae bacterium]
MAGNQKSEYSTSQIDSMTFSPQEIVLYLVENKIAEYSTIQLDSISFMRNSSIYESLEQRGNFRTYLRLLADKDVNPEGLRPLTDVLNRTGSKTVFVANDSAWDAFFAANALLPEGNPWHYATSYEKLSQAQKK